MLLTEADREAMSGTATWLCVAMADGLQAGPVGQLEERGVLLAANWRSLANSPVRLFRRSPQLVTISIRRYGKRSSKDAFVLASQRAGLLMVEGVRTSCS